MFEKETSSKKIMMIRTGIFFLLFVSAVWLPWWVALTGALFFILFKGFYETVLIGTLLDSMYKNQEGLFLISDFIFTASLLVVVFFSLAIFRRLEVVQ